MGLDSDVSPLQHTYSFALDGRIGSPQDVRAVVALISPVSGPWSLGGAFLFRPPLSQSGVFPFGLLYHMGVVLKNLLFVDVFRSVGFYGEAAFEYPPAVWKVFVDEGSTDFLNAFRVSGQSVWTPQFIFCFLKRPPREPLGPFARGREPKIRPSELGRRLEAE